jgi:hypothetical protein
VIISLSLEIQGTGHHQNQGRDNFAQTEEALRRRQDRHITEPITRHQDHRRFNAGVVHYYNSY